MLALSDVNLGCFNYVILVLILLKELAPSRPGEMALTRSSCPVEELFAVSYDDAVMYRPGRLVVQFGQNL